MCACCVSSASLVYWLHAELLWRTWVESCALSWLFFSAYTPLQMRLLIQEQSFLSFCAEFLLQISPKAEFAYKCDPPG
jgi:hypothetical protein